MKQTHPPHFNNHIQKGHPMRDPLTQTTFVASTTRDTDTLKQLALHAEHRVRFSVAYNPHTPQEVLTMFSIDPSAVIRRGAAKNPNTPLELLEELARDEDYIVRKGAAVNPALPTALLTVLMETDEEKEVRESASITYEGRCLSAT